MDSFPRYGSFVGLNPLTDPRLMWHNVLGPGGVRELLWLERTEGYVANFLANCPIRAGDVVIVFSHGGRNAAPVEAARFARETGASVIAVTSKLNLDVPATHSSGKRLVDFADITLDTGVPVEDALVDVDGWGAPVAGASTIVACVCVGELVARTAQDLAAQGASLPTFVSPTVPGWSVEANGAVFDEYRKRLRQAFDSPGLGVLDKSTAAARALPVVLAMDVGGTKTAAAIVNTRGEISARWRWPTDAAPETTIDRLAQIVSDLTDQRGAAPGAIGIAVPAVLDDARERVIWAPNLPRWKDVHICEMLRHKTGLRVAMDFDGHLAAVGEHWLGALRGIDDCVCVVVGTGIGAGVFVHGRLVRGRQNLSGCLGWMVVGDTEARQGGPAPSVGWRARRAGAHCNNSQAPLATVSQPSRWSSSSPLPWKVTSRPRAHYCAPESSLGGP